MQTCNNCSSNFAGKHCSHCGQKASVGELTMGGLAHEAWHSITHTDKGVVRLVKDLLLRPKKVYMGYFSGQRKTYFSPVTFFLISAAILLFIGIKIFDFEDYVRSTSNKNGFNEFGRYDFMLTKFKALLLLPVQILLTKLFFYRQYNLAKHIVFWLYLNGLLFTIQILLSPFSFAFIWQHDIVKGVVSLITTIITLWHLLLVFGKRKWYNMAFCILVLNIIIITQEIISWYMLFGNEMLQRAGCKNIFQFIGKVYQW
jgi:Protein of unknown function (DUF3667)